MSSDPIEIYLGEPFSFGDHRDDFIRDMKAEAGKPGTKNIYIYWAYVKWCYVNNIEPMIFNRFFRYWRKKYRCYNDMQLTYMVHSPMFVFSAEEKAIAKKWYEERKKQDARRKRARLAARARRLRKKQEETS